MFTLHQLLFPYLILFQIFWFLHSHIRKFVTSLLNYPQKISLQNFKPLFYSLNVMVKPLLKLPLWSLPTFSWNLENWKASTWKTKNSIPIKQKQPPEVSCKKKVFLAIRQNSQENTCARFSFLIKLQTTTPLDDCFW